MPSISPPDPNLAEPPPSTAFVERRVSIVPAPGLTALAAVAVVVSLYAALLYAPTDSFQGNIQRIFYIHVPAAITMYVAVTLLFFASILYLQKRDERWDEVGAAAAEVGMLFGSVVMITGPLWARPVWGTWWTWDARLTSTFVLWLIFIAYLMLRAYGGAPDQVARFCAVLGIIGFLDLPIIHFSVVWWRTLHPQPVIMTEEGLGANLPGSMLATWALGMVAALLLFTVLFRYRLRLERISRQIMAMRRLLDFSHSENL